MIELLTATSRSIQLIMILLILTVKNWNHDTILM